MIGLELLSAATLALISLSALEATRHRRLLGRIPLRIHVAGTRGKSSVTRLLAAGLRAAGRTTVAKTTGTIPRTILPDGREVPVFRPAGANIIEQRRVVEAAAGLGAQALVVECMALQPALHWISESKLVRATHGIITNARPDHLDVMGPTDADVARCLAGMIPVGGILYTAEERHLSILREACEDRGTRLIAVGRDEVESVSPLDLDGFSYTEHPENVALALRVLEDQGVGREEALAGMWRSNPDPGAMTVHEAEIFGRRIIFVNAFAANDPESSARIWALARDLAPDVEQRVALFNLRGDRAHRTVQLAGETAFWHDADGVVLMGTGAYLFARVAARAGFDISHLVYAETTRPSEIFESILGLCGRSTLVVGMGNIGGQGLDLVRYFANRAKPRNPA
jgi:gamma-polyglutamate synthase